MTRFDMPCRTAWTTRHSAGVRTSGWRGRARGVQGEGWYRDILGLTHMYTYGKLAFFDCGGTRLMVEERTIIDVPNLHNDSVLYFRVVDINAAHDKLHSRGVSFRGAPHMIFKHPDGTEEWMAFFDDMDGGLLALMSEVKPG